MDIFSLIALSKAKNAESKSIGVYHYKGSVATESALPSQDNVQGDVWNIVDTSTYGPAGTNVAWDGAAWDALGGMAPVTSVNSQTGAVVLGAADVGATPETVLVTVTGSVNESCTADMTFAEISAAYTAGNRLKVVFPISDTYSIMASLEPIKMLNGTIIMFGAAAIVSNGSSKHSVQCIIGFGDGVSVTSTQLAEWDDIPSASSTAPQALGTYAAVGSSSKYAREDHVHPTPTAADIGAEPAVVEYTITGSGEVTTFLQAGKMYHFTGALTSLTLTLTSPSSDQLSQYHFDFTTGSSAPTVTLPSSVIMPDGWNVDADMRYEVDILNNYAVVAGWEVSE